MTDDRIDFIKSNCEDQHRVEGLKFTEYYGFVGTAHNLKTHFVRVTVWDSGTVEIDSICGTTARFNSTSHTDLRVKGESITCKRCPQTSEKRLGQ